MQEEENHTTNQGKFLYYAELSYLRKIYQVFYPSLNFTEVSRLYRECKKFTVNDASLKASSLKSCVRWPVVLGIDPRGEALHRIARVTLYIEHTLTISPDTSKTHIFAQAGVARAFKKWSDQEVGVVIL